MQKDNDKDNDRNKVKNIKSLETGHKTFYFIINSKITFASLSGFNINPLSPKSDQHQISPCNNQYFVKHSGHENYGHDHTRRICLIFYQLLPTTSVGNG